MITIPKMYGMQCDICKLHLKTEENIIAFMRKQDIEEMAESMGWELWNNGKEEYHYCPHCKATMEKEINFEYNGEEAGVAPELPSLLPKLKEILYEPSGTL